MSSFRFIHAADPHIDSPLKGLTDYVGVPAERLRKAARNAFDRMIQLAIQEKVQFVLIAGDLFDGPWKDMSTGIQTASAFRKLKEHQISCFVVQGNHDADSRVFRDTIWPDNVHLFRTDVPETVRLEELNVALHGQGYRNSDCPDDLTLRYPPAIPGFFNIGLLHTALDGRQDGQISSEDSNKRSGNYAPTTEEQLRRLGYDYWALGHVHQRQIVSNNPWILWSGNLQGRHVRETGEKGCYLVSVQNGNVVEPPQFLTTDVLRWLVKIIDLTGIEKDDDFFKTVKSELKQTVQQTDGLFAAVRLVFRGMTPLHPLFLKQAERQKYIQGIFMTAADVSDDLWIEKIKFETKSALDIEKLCSAGDLLGSMLSDLRSRKQSLLQRFHLSSSNSSLSDISNFVSDHSPNSNPPDLKTASENAISNENTVSEKNAGQEIIIRPKENAKLDEIIRSEKSAVSEKNNTLEEETESEQKTSETVSASPNAFSFFSSGTTTSDFSEPPIPDELVWIQEIRKAVEKTVPEQDSTICWENIALFQQWYDDAQTLLLSRLLDISDE